MTVSGVITKQGTDISDLINRAADTANMPTRPLTAQLLAESTDEETGLPDERAERWGKWPDVSFGLGQQTAAYARVGDGSATEENVNLVRSYYFDPVNAIRECATQLGAYWDWFDVLPDDRRYYEAASRYNGGPAMDFADNPNKANIRDAWKRALEYEVKEVPVNRDLEYDSSTRRVEQTDDWSCSVASATWLLRSLGFQVAYQDLEREELSDGIVTTRDGLLDASGTDLAKWLRGTFDIPADNAGDVTWDWLQMHAGHMPIMLGARHWGRYGHWVAVRGVDEDGTLELANPAEGYTDIYETLDQAQFNRVGPCSAVWVEVEDMARIQELEQQVQEKNAQIAEMDSLLGYLTGDAAQQAVDAINEAKENHTDKDPRQEGRAAQLDSALAALATIQRRGADA